MSMARRMTLLMVAVLLGALIGSLAIHSLAARRALQLQIDQRNRDAAAALASAMSTSSGDPQVLQVLAERQFSLSHYQRIRLKPEGEPPLVDLARPPSVTPVPGWFVAAVPLVSRPGRAPVARGSGELGMLEVEADIAWAHATLWNAYLRTAVLLAVLGVVATLLSLWAMRGWRRPLLATIAQAQALEQGRFVEAEEPRIPELRELTRSMNATVRRLREVFASQAEQVELLQRQAQLDAVTGLPLRAHFIGQLQQRLAEQGGGPGVALLIIRVLQLEALNPRLGREATDGLLGGIADVLETYVQRVAGTFAGRLNGSDFALCLPVAGVAAETAASLRNTLAAAPALRAGGVEIVVGGADGLHDMNGSAALAAADAALARAEVEADTTPGPDAGLVVEDHGSDTAADAEAIAGERAWREQIAVALEQGRTRLAEFTVVDHRGRELHLECPLRVQLQPDGDYQVAERWLAMARRGRLMPQVDLTALDLALQAIARDGRARAVHASSASLASPGFVLAATQRLAAAPEAARLLAIECVEAPRLAETGAGLGEAAQAWRRHGVRIGVEHAGASPQRLPGLQVIGVDYVKVDARHLRGAAGDAAVRGYAQSLVALIHGLGLTAIAGGIADERDLAVLWALGYDAATGPAVKAKE